MIARIAKVLLLAALGTVAIAQEFSDVAQEVTADMVTLPSDEHGDVVVKACNSCHTRTFGITASTTWEIGTVTVRLDEMRRELAQRPSQIMLLQLTPDFKNVARIKIPAARY